MPKLLLKKSVKIITLDAKRIFNSRLPNNKKKKPLHVFKIFYVLESSKSKLVFFIDEKLYGKDHT